MRGDNAHGVLSVDSSTGILTCAFLRGTVAGIDVCEALLSAGALSCEPSLGGTSATFSSPRKAVCALAELVALRPDQLSAGLATGEVEAELSRLKLLDEAQGIAGLSETGQVLLSLGTVELVRQRLDVDASFVDLGTRPLANSGPPTRVFALVLPGLAPGRPPEIPKRPWFGHRFIGRTEEIDRITEALTQFRLVSLVGPTGIGKTALAARVELEIQDQFADGSNWVDLKLVTRPVLLIHRIAQALEIHSTQEKTLLDQVTRKLLDSEVLLILDGVDAVQDAVAELCDHLLRECPKVSVMVTGSRRLNSTTEFSILLEGMQRPSPGEPLETVREYDAIRVFVEEAVSSDPSFCITSSNVEAISLIAEIVDGSPWALKMAASRLSVLSPQQLLARLKYDPLELLHDREKGLELAMRASLGILSPWGQVLFRRLSVFSGPFDAEAVEEVCAFDENLPKAAVLAAMRELYEVHLMQPFHSPRRSRAFFLSPLAGELASRLCREASEVGDLGRAQSKYLSAKIQQAVAAISTGRAEALAEFDLLYEDMRGRWLKRLRTRGGGEVAKAVVGIAPYWFQRGYYSEALDMASRVFEAKDVEKDPEFVRVLSLATWACIRTAEFEQAKTYARMAVRWIFDQGSLQYLARAMNAAGCVAFELDRQRTALRLLREASRLAKEHADSQERAIRLNYAMELCEQGQTRAAHELFMSLWESCQQTGWADLTLLVNIADVRLQLGDVASCWQWLVSACDQFEATPDPNLLASAYSTGAWASFHSDRAPESWCLLQAYDAIETFYGLTASPRRVRRREKLEWHLQGRRGLRDAWNPAEPTKLLKSIAMRYI